VHLFSFYLSTRCVSSPATFSPSALSMSTSQCNKKKNIIFVLLFLFLLFVELSDVGWPTVLHIYFAWNPIVVHGRPRRANGTKWLN